MTVTTTKTFDKDAGYAAICELQLAGVAFNAWVQGSLVDADGEVWVADRPIKVLRVAGGAWRLAVDGFEETHRTTTYAPLMVVVEILGWAR